MAAAEFKIILSEEESVGQAALRPPPGPVGTPSAQFTPTPAGSGAQAQIIPAAERRAAPAAAEGRAAAAVAAPEAAAGARAATAAGGAAAGEAAGGGMLASITSALGPVGIAATAVAGTLAALGTAVKLLSDQFIARGRELAQYSGPLAAAGAQADIRSMMADIREAMAVGPATARLTGASSNIATDLRDMILPIKVFVVETLASIMEEVRDFVKWAKPTLTGWITAIIEVLKSIPAILKGKFDFAKLQKTIQQAMENAQKKNDEAPNIDAVDMLDEALRAENQPNIRRGFDPMRAGIIQALNMPVLQ